MGCGTGLRAVRYQPMQPEHQRLWSGVPIVAVIMDTFEENTNFIHPIKQHGGMGQVHLHIAVAHGAKEIFQGMAKGLQMTEPKEATGALDGVDCPEGAGDTVIVPGGALQCHDILFQLPQVLVTFDQKALQCLVVFLHRAFSPWNLS